MSAQDNQLTVGTLGLRSVRIVMRHDGPAPIHNWHWTSPPRVPWADLSLTLELPDGTVRDGEVSVPLRDLYTVREVEVEALAKLRWCVPQDTDESWRRMLTRVIQAGGRQ